MPNFSGFKSSGAIHLEVPAAEVVEMSDARESDMIVIRPKSARHAFFLSVIRILAYIFSIIFQKTMKDCNVRLLGLRV
jgi:hypothetical protein